MDEELQLRCTCRVCQRARYWREVRASAGVVIGAVMVIVAMAVACLLLTGCATTVSECEHGYSWRGDCAQPLFKE